MQTRREVLTAALSLVLAGGVRAVFAHGEPTQAKKAAPQKEQKPWGVAGDPKAAKRVVEVRMLDTMRFSPDSIEVKQGETIRFVLKNDGKMLHEFVIGARQDLDKHAALMQKFPNMEHDEPYMAHVAPGKSAEITWNFNRAGDFLFACLIAGHYQAGMVGKIKVVAR